MKKSLLLSLFISSSILISAQPMRNEPTKQPQNPVGGKQEQSSATPRNPVGDNNKRGEWSIERGKPGYKTNNSAARKSYNEAMNYYNGTNGYKRDYRKAYNGFYSAANQGDQLAQYQLGICYYYGRGVESNKQQAVEWWKKSAENDCVQAQYELGRSYYKGDGVKRNYNEALKWLTKSANSGNANAQYLLGEMYYNGKGVSRNQDKANHYWQLSANQGNRNANEQLDKHQNNRR